MALLSEEEIFDVAHIYMEDNYTGSSEKVYKKQLFIFLDALFFMNDLHTERAIEADLERLHAKAEKALAKLRNAKTE